MVMKMGKFIRNLLQRQTLFKEFVIAFTIVSMIMTILGYLLYYNTTFKILQNRQEIETIQQFKQLDRNFINFFDSINKVSVILLDNLSKRYNSEYEDGISQLMKINDYSDDNAISLLNNMGNDFSQLMEENSLIDSIFIYTGKGGVIGRRATFSKSQIRGEMDEYVYKSGLYENIVENYPKLQWFGGNNIQNIGGFDDHGSSDNDASLITAARSFKSIYSDNSNGSNGVLLININESELTDYYKYAFDYDKSNAYIVDTSGKIISGVDNSLLGTKSTEFNEIDLKKDYGSFVQKDGKDKKNIFYYKVKYTGWILFYEVPLSMYRKDINILNKILVLIFVINLILILAISLLIMKRITIPLNSLTSAMRKIGNGSLGLMINNSYNNEFGLLAKRFNQMSLDIENLMKEKEEIEKKKREQEIAALQAQINPHFILNTINTIKWMAVLANTSNIAESMSVFGDLLKPLLKMKSDFNTVKEEIEYLKNYVKILNYRYGNIIKLNVELPDELFEYKLPRFILQPIIENAVQHGMDSTNQPFMISITAAAEDENIQIKVCNNGKEISKEKLDEIRLSLRHPIDSENNASSRIGLSNIEKRLNIYYGHGYGLAIDSNEERNTVVTIIVPMQG